MIDLNPLENLFNRAETAVPCDHESDYFELWQRHGLNQLTPTAAAISGAALADRLTWVFAAGYQATLRNAFSMLAPEGWAAFAATEDAHDPVGHPGTTLTQTPAGTVLNGHKSWVAHSQLVEHLIITLNDPHGDKRKARGLIVNRHTPGVSLSHRERPKFLATMSQGFVAFEDVVVRPESIFEFEPIRQFGRTEAKFVMLASSSFMLARVPAASALHDRLLSVAGALLALIEERNTSRQVYAAIDRVFQGCVDDFESSVRSADIPDYAADGRLMRMYTEKIQRRAGYAAAEAKAQRS